jgi:hypothetical protein
MRARALIGTVAGVLAMSTGVALAETSPPDPEVVEVPADPTTTTTALPSDEEPTATTTTSTTVVADEPTTTTTTVVVDEPDVVDPNAVDPVDDLEEPVAAERPQNHGYFVSQAAHDRSGEGRNHGASVSAVARSDAGKPGKG